MYISEVGGLREQGKFVALGRSRVSSGQRRASNHLQDSSTSAASPRKRRSSRPTGPQDVAGPSWQRQMQIAITLKQERSRSTPHRPNRNSQPPKRQPSN